MPYCPRCGVEIEDRLERCPLCETPIPHAVRDAEKAHERDFPKDVIRPKPMYRELSDKEKRVLVTGLIAFVGLFPIAITMGLDLLRSGRVTWSYYVLVPVLGAALIAWFFYRFGRRPLVSVTTCMVILLLIEILIEMKVSSVSRFLIEDLPFFAAAFLAIELLLIFIVKAHPNPVQLLAVIFIDTSLLVIGIDWIISQSVSWSGIVTVCLLWVSVYLIYIDRTKRRGLNIIGFLFLDVAMMLLSLELAISGRMNWSIVTTMIFIPISILFYILHLTLFNDTDWKKALHL